MDMQKQWILDLECLIKVGSTAVETVYIFHFGLDESIYGHNSPRLDFLSNKISYKFRINNDNGGQISKRHLNSVDNIQLHRWYKIHVSQLLQTDGKYMYKMVVDGNEEFLLENTHPAEVKGSRVRIGPGYGKGSIRNVRFVTHDCPSGTYFNGEDCEMPGLIKNDFQAHCRNIIRCRAHSSKHK